MGPRFRPESSLIFRPVGLCFRLQSLRSSVFGLPFRVFVCYADNAIPVENLQISEAVGAYRPTQFIRVSTSLSFED